MASILSFIFSCRFERPHFFHPFTALVFFALAQLALCVYDERTIFIVSCIILGYLFYEAVYSSEVSFKAFRNVVIGFAAITIFFSMFQVFGVNPRIIRYLTPHTNIAVNGIWTCTAYCGAFLAFSVPYTLSLKPWFKWIILAFTGFIIWKTQSVFAGMAAALILSIYLFFENRKLFILLGLTSIGACLFHYWDFQIGNGSGEMERLYIWKKAIKSFLAEPFFGHGLGSFMRLGMENIFTMNKTTGILFPHAHNEYIQILQEGGVIGFFILISAVIRTTVLTFRHSLNESIFTIGLSLLVIFLISFGQSLFHAPNIVIFAIAALALFELKIRRFRNAY